MLRGVSCKPPGRGRVDCFHTICPSFTVEEGKNVVISSSTGHFSVEFPCWPLLSGHLEQVSFIFSFKNKTRPGRQEGSHFTSALGGKKHNNKRLDTRGNASLKEQL